MTASRIGQAAARSRSGRLVVPGLALVAASALAAGVGAYYWFRVPLPQPPEINLALREPPLAAAVREARAELDRSPRSAAAWGRLGVVLAAYQIDRQATVCFDCA